MFEFISYISYLFLAYFLWHFIIMPYYKVLYYYRQGIPLSGTPYPLLSDIIGLLKAFNEMTLFESHPFIMYFQKCFGKKIPPIFVDVKMRNPELVICDPEMTY